MATYKDWLNGRPKRRRVASVESIIEHAEWLARMWSVFAGISFAIAVGYWFEFRRVYDIPVAFGSSSALASLPALFGIVLLCSLVLAVLLLSPSCGFG
jgi:hypothetical protein